MHDSQSQFMGYPLVQFVHFHRTTILEADFHHSMSPHLAWTTDDGN